MLWDILKKRIREIEVLNNFIFGNQSWEIFKQLEQDLYAWQDRIAKEDEAAFQTTKDEKVRVIERLEAELETLRITREFQYQQAVKYSRYAEALRDALHKIEAVQHEGYGAGDSWKAIREIINRVPHIDNVSPKRRRVVKRQFLTMWHDGCHWCNGKGYLPLEPSCDDCGGSGVKTHIQVYRIEKPKCFRWGRG